MKKRLYEIEADFCSVTVEKNALLEQVIEQHTKNCSLCAEVIGLCNTLEERLSAQNGEKQLRSSLTLLMVDVQLICMALQSLTSLAASCVGRRRS